VSASNEEAAERARAVMPGGVSSPVRSFRSVGGVPVTIARGEGPYVWDVEGRRYIDWVQSYGATILGHAHAAVVGAVTEASSLGLTFGAPTPGETLLAEEVVSRVPGCESVRFVSTGTEAVMTAVRLARGATGRDGVVVFAGCYHGHSDGLLASGGSGMATLATPASAGVPAASVSSTVVAPYNHVPPIDESVACVVVEPVAANMGLVPPEPGFLEGLRQACDRAGALLVFDEVITGFRVSRGGASHLLGVTPDLWCFGKVLGGGLPLAAVAGRRDLMATLAPLGPVYQAGTLSGNPLATAAGLAALRQLDDEAYERMAHTAETLQRMTAEAIEAAGLVARVPRVTTLVGIFLSGQPVTDYETASAAAANGRYPVFFHAALESGVMLAPGPYEVLFPGLAHTDDLIETTAEALGKAAAAAREGAR
jgi:glutamate-1-semialdehyde 2,1-aminomutase